MAEYAALETSTYEQVTAAPFTRIPGKPSWQQKETLVEEAEDLTMLFRVSYPWANGHGLLAVIQGAKNYLATSGKNYVQPDRPENQHPDIFVTIPRAPTQQQVKNLEAKNENWKRDYAVYSGFCRGCRENMMKALDAQYYDQLLERTFKYGRILPQDFITQLKTK